LEKKFCRAWDRALSGATNQLDLHCGKSAKHSGTHLEGRKYATGCALDSGAGGLGLDQTRTEHVLIEGEVVVAGKKGA
jgi:hypothetical protein